MEEKGEHESALDFLAQLVRRGADKGIVRSFVDYGPRVKRLLDELSKRMPADEYSDSLRAAFDAAGPAGRAATGIREPLTHRELETLSCWRIG
jgi:hypothetical protein